MQTSPFSRLDQPAYFDAMLAKSNDPWKFRSRCYERRKHALTLACLPSGRYMHGFEPGCANGELSVCLATRCDRLLVSDGAQQVAALANDRLEKLPNVEVRKAWTPEEWPLEKFDLIVLNEFLLYVQPAMVEQIAQKAQASLMPGGVILACHWRHPIEGCVLDGDDIHDALRHFIRLPNQCHVQEPDLQLDVWSSGPTMAQKEGTS